MNGVSEIRSAVEEALPVLGRARHRLLSGSNERPDLAKAHRQLGTLFHPETIAAIREAPVRSERGERQKAAMLGFLIPGCIEAECAATLDEGWGVERAREISTGPGDKCSLLDALMLLGTEPLSEHRHFIERELSRYDGQFRELTARRLDGAQRAAAKLGAKDYLELWPASEPDHEDARAFLRETEDAYRDLLTHLLRRMDALIRPHPTGTARWSDLRRVLVAPMVQATFPREELPWATSRFVEQLGFHPEASGRIRLEHDGTNGYRPGAFVTPVRVPGEVPATVRGADGMDGYRHLLWALGTSLSLAHVAEDARLEERVMGDFAVHYAVGQVFEDLTLDAPWLKRHLRLHPAAAREAARVAAFRSLADLRERCVRLMDSVELSRRGASPSVLDDFSARWLSTMFVGVPPAPLWNVELPHTLSERVRASAVTEDLRCQLEGRFNEDWWRNPAAGAWLKARFAVGTAPESQATARSTLPKGVLSLRQCGARYVRIMGA